MRIQCVPGPSFSSPARSVHASPYAGKKRDWGRGSLVPSPSFLALECAGNKKVGPGIHCLHMHYKNLMNLIIKSSRDANLRHTHKHSTVP